MTWDNIRLRVRIALRYRWPWLIGYADGKMLSDPVYREVFRLIGDSSRPLLDIGCGMGLLAFYLRERGYRPAITGLDVDEKKVRRAAALAHRHYADMGFHLNDCGQLPPFAGHVTMLDMLHYLDPDRQIQVLREVAARVAPDGWAIIRVTPCDNSWRFRCSLAVEVLARRLTWMVRDAISFPRLDDIAGQFPEAEFSRDIRPLWGHTPFNSWLLAFQRRP